MGIAWFYSLYSHPFPIARSIHPSTHSPSSSLVNIRSFLRSHANGRRRRRFPARWPLGHSQTGRAFPRLESPLSTGPSGLLVPFTTASLLSACQTRFAHRTPRPRRPFVTGNGAVSSLSFHLLICNNNTGARCRRPRRRPPFTMVPLSRIGSRCRLRLGPPLLYLFCPSRLRVSIASRRVFMPPLHLSLLLPISTLLARSWLQVRVYINRES
ncbi:hypothetical protein EDB89DRAFT_1972866 [Lactarius sanguifluus]|nr:hypothetical protein EDB89DRAFT_1972866 [Lactarius sanguifluus]